MPKYREKNISGGPSPVKGKTTSVNGGGKETARTCPLALKVGKRVFCFLPWGKYRIGSLAGAELPLRDLSVEEVHCEILPSPQGLRMVDRSGRTFLEGSPVEEVDLSPGMRLHLGKVPLEVILREEADRAYLVPPRKGALHPGATGIPGDLSRALRRYQEALGPSFSEELRRGLRSAPWLTLSLAAHLVLLFLAWNLPLHQGSEKVPATWTAWEPHLENQAPPGPIGEDPNPGDLAREIPHPDFPETESFLETRLSPSPLKDPGVYLGLSGGSLAEKILQAGGAPEKTAPGRGGTRLTPHLTGTAPPFRRKVEALRKSGMDSILVLDATASMTFGLHLARASLLDILYAQAALVPDHRTGLVVFRDSREDPSSSLPAPVLPLSRNPWAVMDFLETLSAGGGGSPRESLLAPLKRALSLFPSRKEGRRRVILLVGDAPGPPEEERALRGLVRRFHQEEGGILSTIFTGPPPQKSPFSGEALEEFQVLARLGGGRCAVLKDQASMVRETLALLLGEEGGGNLEKVLQNLSRRPGVRVRIAKRKLEAGSLDWILGQFALSPVPAGVVREVLRRPRPALLARLLELLEEGRSGEVPLAGRQAALFVLKKTLPPFPLTGKEISGGFLRKKTLRALRNALER